MIKIELQETDLKTWLAEQSRLSQLMNTQIIDANRALAKTQEALLSEQHRHAKTADKIFTLESQVTDHKREVLRHKDALDQATLRHKTEIEEAKKAPPDSSLVAIELTELLRNLLGGKPNKIDAIKVVRVLTGWGLKEAKDLYEAVETGVAKRAA